ncbi:MAG: hypothetical protein ABIQ40_04280 [Bacteroidia bacterium]
MSEELLKINKLATLNELRYILLEVLIPERVIERRELNAICKQMSWSLAIAFDDTIHFMEVLSLIKINARQMIVNDLSAIDISKLGSDYSFSIFLAQRVVDHLTQSGLLSKIFNSKVLTFDKINNSWVINLNHLPFKYPFVKNFLLNVELVIPDKHVNSKSIVADKYKSFFSEAIVDRIILKENLIVDDRNISKEYNVFISYMHRDEIYKNELKEHLIGLVKVGVIKKLTEKVVLDNYNLEPSINQYLKEANIVLFLVSSAFISSNYTSNTEILNVIEKHNKKIIIIVPIIARSCDFSSLPLFNYEVLPKDAIPINKWEDRDEAYLSVVDYLKVIMK